jgi:hypothetical protein
MAHAGVVLDGADLPHGGRPRDEDQGTANLRISPTTSRDQSTPTWHKDRDLMAFLASL